MVIHPPMLYMGYVGFSVAFAFAIAALLDGRLDATWARWSRPWTTVAWVFLTLGIALGSCWAYYELGWGGWWFWDPVENASFMPWLVGTALIHSLAVTEKRGAFRAGRCCSPSSPSRLSACSAPSSCARACSPRCMPSPPIRSAASSSWRPVRRRHRRLAGAVRVARCARRAGRRFRAGVARVACCSPTTCCCWSAAGAVMLGTLYPLLLDALGAGQDLGRAAVLRDRVRAADGAGAVPDGRRAARALEAGQRAGACRAAALGARRELRGAACSCRSPWASWYALVGLRPAARAVDRRHRPAHPAQEPGARNSRAHYRHGARAHRRRRVRRRRDAGEGLRGRERRAHGGGRHDRAGRLRVPLGGVRDGGGAELPRGARAHDGHARGQDGRRRCIRRSASTPCRSSR